MKARFLLTGLLVGAVACVACGYPRPMSSEYPAAGVPAPTPAPVTVSSHVSHVVSFPAEIQPILENRCQPCHFAGGKMYERLPFDKAETIVGLGDKLFTRIKDENEQRTIREFLAQEASAAGP